MGISSSFFSTAPGRAIGSIIHKRAIAGQPRNQSLATSLFRNIRQVSAFEGPLADVPRNGMKVLVAGCSLGCEAYTLAGYLKARFPELDARISAFDIDAEAIAHARRGFYGEALMNASILSGPFRDAAETLLEPVAGGFQVRPDCAAMVAFATGDALAGRPDEAAAYDAVFAQNFMVHMPDGMAEKALDAMAACLRPGGAMFLGGMMLDMREKAAARHGLRPVDWSIREIHDEDAVRRNAWPFTYWSLEPLDDGRPDWRRRYATIFRKAK